MEKNAGIKAQDNMRLAQGMKCKLLGRGGGLANVHGDCENITIENAAGRSATRKNMERESIARKIRKSTPTLGPGGLTRSAAEEARSNADGQGQAAGINTVTFGDRAAQN